MPARARQEAVESEEDAAVLDGVVIGADPGSLAEGTVVRAPDGAADVDVAVADGVVDEEVARMATGVGAGRLAEPGRGCRRRVPLAC